MVDLAEAAATEPARRADPAQRARRWGIGLVVSLGASVVAGIALGAVYVPFGSVLDVLGHHLFLVPGERTWSAPRDSIVWDVRLPRVLLAALVGAGLAVTGMALQAMVRNLLADPYLLGVSSGASTGAAAAILFGVTLGLGEHVLSASAFAGAVAAAALVYVVARSAGRVTSTRLLLAGVAVGYALQAATSFLIFASDSAEGARSVMFWLLGSLALAAWGQPLALAAAVVVLAVAALTVLGRRLDALAVGDETALTLGVAPERLRTGLLVLVALCVAVVVSAAGAVGFVGLVVPHLARRAVGAAHTRAMPIAALMGAILLIWADVVARVLLAPQEIPIGIVTAVLGAPFLLILVRRLQVTA